MSDEKVTINVKISPEAKRKLDVLQIFDYTKGKLTQAQAVEQMIHEIYDQKIEGNNKNE